MSVEYVMDEENHQFVNVQKAEKVRMKKIVTYLEGLRWGYER